MRKVAIVYTSRLGHTSKIAARLKFEFEKRDCYVDSYNLNVCTPVIDPDVETVIYGSPVYAGHFSRRLKSWILKNHASLRTKTRAFFSVSLNRADSHEEARETDRRLLRDFFTSSGLVPDYAAAFGGCLAYTRYPRLLRRKMRQIAARAGGSVDVTCDHDYTNWDDVISFAADICDQKTDSKFALGRTSFDELDRFAREYELSFMTSIEIDGFSADELFRLAEVSFDLRSNCTQIERSAPTSLTYARMGHVTPLSFKPFAVLEASALQKSKIPGVTKEFINLTFKITGADRVRVIGEFRVHSTDSRARERARHYYRLAGPWIRFECRRYLARLRTLGAESLLQEAERAATN